mmetsp:Transcript_55458/g.127456  ORF Transcript_55458/g.127456 Transcript_55458/m.127456 type:complete len:238 (-) Transcript_55458:198-911(-)
MEHAEHSCHSEDGETQSKQDHSDASRHPNPTESNRMHMHYCSADLEELEHPNRAPAKYQIKAPKSRPALGRGIMESASTSSGIPRERADAESLRECEVAPRDDARRGRTPVGGARDQHDAVGGAQRRRPERGERDSPRAQAVNKRLEALALLGESKHRWRAGGHVLFLLDHRMRDGERIGHVEDVRHAASQHRVGTRAHAEAGACGVTADQMHVAQAVGVQAGEASRVAQSIELLTK